MVLVMVVLLVLVTMMLLVPVTVMVVGVLKARAAIVEVSTGEAASMRELQRRRR
jgi:uncharacterized protein YpuA (DUF1002 family)